MRAILRNGPILLAAALLLLAPTVSPGGPPPPGHKGPFDIDPRTERANEDFDLSVDRGDGDPCGVDLPPFSEPGDGQPTAVLLGEDSPNVHVQVVDTEGNAGPAGTVLESEDYNPNIIGDWDSPPTIPLNLPAGTYLVTAECTGVNGAESASAESSASSGSEPVFILLGAPPVESPRCTEVEGEQQRNDEDGCYEPQELVIEGEEAGPAAAEQEEPTFTG